MNTNNNLILWLVETIKRFGQKSPKFFKVWQWVLGLLTTAMGLPKLLQAVKVIHALPGWLEAIANADAAFAFLGAFIMTYQTTQSKPVSIKEDGTIVKETNIKALPFTAVHEVKLATKENNNEIQNNA